MTHQESDETGEVFTVIPDDKDIAEVRQFSLDETLDVSWGYVLTSRRDDQL